MNNNFEKVAQIAKTVNMGGAAMVVGDAIAEITSRSKLHIAIAGGQNSGKTTIINSIAGKEVREVSNISEDDELPLRMSFERSVADGRFECVDVFDKTWNEMGTVFFEMKDTDLVNNGQRTKLADEVDLVFYLISAMGAFTAGDVSALKALRNHKVILILTKLDSIEEADKESVLRYVENMGAKLGLDAPIIIDKGNVEDTGKLLQRAIPSYVERKEQKEAYCQMLIEELTDAVREELHARISNVSGASILEADNEIMGKTRSRALIAKKEVLELGAARASSIGRSDKLADILAKRMEESGQKASYSENWQANVKKKVIDPVFEAEFAEERAKLKKSLIRDCSGIDATEEERRQLERQVDEVLSGSVQVAAVKDFGSQGKIDKTGINMATVGITSAVVAGALFIPIPAIATWVISLGAVAIGTSSVIAEKNKAEQAAWSRQINAYAKVIAKQFCDGLKIYNNKVYEEMADYVYSEQIKEGRKLAQQRSGDANVEKETYQSLLAELG